MLRFLDLKVVLFAEQTEESEMTIAGFPFTQEKRSDNVRSSSIITVVMNGSYYTRIHDYVPFRVIPRSRSLQTALAVWQMYPAYPSIIGSRRGLSTPNRLLQPPQIHTKAANPNYGTPAILFEQKKIRECAEF